MAQQRILGPRDYFSDRTFGDIAVQGMQIKGMRGRIEEDEARRGAYAKAYGGDPSAGYEAEARQGKRKRELAALGQAFGLVDNIYKTYGLEGAKEMSKQIWDTTPEFQRAFPSGPPKIEKGKGKELFWTLETQKERKLPNGEIIPAGTMAKFRVVDGKPVEVMGVVKSAKKDKAARTREKAEDKMVELTGKLHTLDSNVMAYTGDPTAYRKSLVQALEHNNQFLPEGRKWKPKPPPPPKRPFPLHSQIMDLTKQPMPAQAAPAAGGFDPESADYDMESAKAAGMGPDETGHWPSRDPRTGLILKGSGHPTFNLTIEGERAAGHEIYKGEDGRYYSKPIGDDQAPPAPAGKQPVRTGTDAQGRKVIQFSDGTIEYAP